MKLEQTTFSQVVEAAKTAAANSPKWLRAIDKAAAAIIAGELIITTLGHGALVTSANGSYHANGKCQCAAAQRGHAECYHRAAARLWERYEMAILKARPAAKPARRSAPRIVRSIERDFAGARIQVTYCDGWAI
jgi:hypothetical protein